MSCKENGKEVTDAGKKHLTRVGECLIIYCEFIWVYPWKRG